MNAPLLQIDDLHVTFSTPLGEVRAVRGVTLDVAKGEVLGIVGESGCGKSVTFRALLGLTPGSSRVEGTVRLHGDRIDTEGSLCASAAMVYQNPGAALNPVFTIGQQLALVAGTKDRAVLAKLLTDVGLPDPATALDAYPHEFSGGMRQRAVIAFALAQSPELLIADEPTTALDVTTQAQVLDLIGELRDSSDLTVVLVSHDLAVIRRVCDRVAVLYAGQVVEVGATNEVLHNPTHPYTAALLASTPRLDNVARELPSIPGMVPDGRSVVEGCAFAPRCGFATPECTTWQPVLRTTSGRDHEAACLLVGEAS